MFNVTYHTRYGDYKDFDTIKVGSVLDFIQDVSTKDSASKGYGIHELRAMGAAWLLQGITLHFEKPVSTLYPVDAYTAVKSTKGVTSERGCVLKQNGETVAKSIASWFLFDIANGTFRRIDTKMASAYPLHNFEDDFFTYKKPATYNLDSYDYKVKIANKDIDTNLHLNNQKAADILMDALPFDFKFNHLNLLYKKQAHLGDVLEVCTKQTDNGYYVHIQTPEKEICVAGTFENI